MPSTTLSTLLSLALHAVLDPAVAEASFAPTWWQPSPQTTWQIVLSQSPSSSLLRADTAAYDTDLFDTSASFISAVHAQSQRSICYFSAGSYERWRPDAGDFAEEDLGRPLDGWPGERWLNVSSAGVRAIMAARLDSARDKGCDAVDPDNVDGYDNKNGLGLTVADAVAYVKWLATEAHARGMGVGLKNAGGVVGSVVQGREADSVDFAVNEQCVRYKECGGFRRFLDQGKPVFHIEYVGKKASEKAVQKKLDQSCNAVGAQGFETLVKRMDLGTWERTCP